LNIHAVVFVKAHSRERAREGLFTILYLGATIDDGGTSTRSDVMMDCYFFILNQGFITQGA